MVVDGIEYCDKCESVIENRFYQDRAMDIRLTGGYGMFMDLMDVELIFCHSCSVEFFRSIPKLSPDKVNGMHSVPYDAVDYPLCCEYSWSFNKIGEGHQYETIHGTKEDFDKRSKS
jgi:hypothetical protein